MRRRNGQLRKGNDELNKEISELRQELAGYEKDKKVELLKINFFKRSHATD